MTTQELAKRIGATHIAPCVTDRYYALFTPYIDRYGMKIYRINYMVYSDNEATLLSITGDMIALPCEAIAL